ncbi:MAG TPA: PadR family transcriptional regulator [Ktedonobacteraceae bacterium]|nr:PadR family transcriptional regulator [Ktedonobacteraceae bacterium]
MYEFLILSQLMKNPAHGYLIASIINDIIGPYARISNGRLYPLLAKLEQAGLIAVRTEPASTPPGDRQLRVYEITGAGKKRYRVLMMDTTLNPGEYQKLFSLKVCDFAFLTPAERLRLIDHYTHYCQAHMIHLTMQMEEVLQESSSWWPEMDPAGKKAHVERVLRVMQHYIDEWQLEHDWAKSLREMEMAQAHPQEPAQVQNQS